MVDSSGKRARLSPADRAMIESGRFAGDFTPEHLLDRMRNLARFDASNAVALARTRRLFAIGLLLAIGGVIGNSLSRPWMYVVVGLGILLAIVAGILLRRLGTIDLPKNFRDVALPFLALLKQDMAANANIHVSIDLCDPRRDRKRRGAPRVQQGSGGRRTIETTYCDDWFHGEAALADGSTLRWDVTEHIVDRTRSKRSRSNRLKTKSRSIKRSVIRVVLSVPRARYDVVQGRAPKDAKIAVRSDDKRSTIKLVRKIKTASLDPINPRVLVDTVSSAYRRLAAPARSAA